MNLEKGAIAMTNRKPAISLCLLALALCWGALPALADGLTLNGTFDGDATITPTASPGVYTQNFTGDGDDTTYGSFTPTSTSTVDFSNPPNILFSNGMLSAAFTNGTLTGTSSGTGTANGNGTAAFTIDWVITGGTGIFAGDTGDVTLMGTITTTSPTTEAISNGTYTGSLATTPEPSTAILLGTALVMVVVGLGWRRSIETTLAKQVA